VKKIKNPIVNSEKEENGSAPGVFVAETTVNELAVINTGAFPISAG